MWHAVAHSADLPEGSGRTVEAANRRIALFHTEGKFHAIDGACPHRGGPLGDGHLEGSTVTCPWHAWDFDVKTGQCVTMPGMNQTSYRTKVENGEVFIEIL